ncbi:immunoglobulin domain-containing protein [Nocardioides humi]|uniref:Ig-like domain-containing protein n=1 Tax=Nocardioides humi TaxID=449461 RepID=A0ABN2BVI0_9ACTN|nr:immunoglobulin domain-containing protein [Nocardioides humi]
MSVPSLPGRRPRWASAVTAGALVLGGMILTSSAAEAAPPTGELDHVSFEWGLNNVHQGGSPAGGCNYFVAGYGDGTEASYATVDRDLRIVKRTADGELKAVGFDNRCAQDGTDATIGQRMLFTDGEGTRAEDGTTTVHWDGAITIYAYGGLVPWYVADPVLRLDSEGNGTIKVKVGGFSSSMADPNVKEPLEPTTDVTVATISGATFDDDGKATIDPVFAGVDYFPLQADGTRSATSAIPPAAKASNPNWGSWPEPFTDFQYRTGLSSYWHTSGLSADPSKPPLPITMDLDAEELVQAPVVVRQPQSTTVSVGADVTLTTMVTGAPEPTVVWQRLTGEEWVDIADATGTELVLTDQTVADSGGQYRVKITNDAGETTSQPATVTVVEKVAVAITAQPADATALAGRSASFSVTATGSTLKYAWQRKLPEENWADYGGTNATMSENNISADIDGAQYRVSVTNGVDEPVISETATLSVETAPLVITTDLSDLTVPAGSGQYLRVDFTGAPYGTWTWQRSTDDGATWQDVQSAPAYNESTSYYLSAVPASADGHRYRVVGDNGIGEPVASSVARLSVATEPLAIVSGLTDVTTPAGRNAIFRIQSTGAPGGDWTFETSTDDGATWTVASEQTNNNYPTLSLNAVTPDQDGTLVRASGTNGLGESLTSGPVRLTVTAIEPRVTTQPTSFRVAEGTMVVPYAACDCAPYPEWTWQTSSDGGETWTDHPDFSGPTGARAQTFWNFSDTTLANDGMLIRAKGDNGHHDPFYTDTARLDVEPRSGRAIYVAPEYIPASIHSATQDRTIGVGLDGFQTDRTDGSIRVSLVERGVWEPGTLLTSAQWLASTTGSISLIEERDDGRFAARLRPSRALSLDKQYEIVVHHQTEVDPRYEERLPILLEGQVEITGQPEDATTHVGRSATFTATAAGGPDRTVQWQESADGETWTDVADATEETLEVRASADLDGRRYRLVATVGDRTATSEPAALTVGAPLPAEVVEQPADVRVAPGEVASFGVEVASDSPETYQWQRSNDEGATWADLQDATSATLDVTAASADNGALFRVVVTNDGGEVASQPARLIVVHDTASITQQPEDTTVAAGETARFTVRATGSYLDYQWQSSTDGSTWTEVADADTRTLSVPTATTAQNGTSYRVVVSSPAGPLESEPATLSVVKARPSVTATATIGSYGDPTTVGVTVAAPPGVPAATGTVTVAEGDDVLATVPLEAGSASVVIDQGVLSPGSRSLAVSYSGDANLEAGSTTAIASVAKAPAKVKAALPAKSLKPRSRAKVRVTVTSPGLVPTGRVKVTWKHKRTGKTVTVTGKLVNGKVVVRSKPLSARGAYKVKATYLGSDTIAKATAKARRITVR